jgi:hypothetical protein
MARMTTLSQTPKLAPPAVAAHGPAVPGIPQIDHSVAGTMPVAAPQASGLVCSPGASN